MGLIIEELHDRQPVSYTHLDVYKRQVIITLTVYDYEHFHKADIDELQAGDTLRIDGKECLITSIDRQESGRIEINGGPAQGGEELRMVEEDSLYGSEMVVGRSYHKLGEVTLQMDENFVLTDVYKRQGKDEAL